MLCVAHGVKKYRVIESEHNFLLQSCVLSFSLFGTIPNEGFISVFGDSLMKSNATCSGLILSFHHAQTITVVFFKEVHQKNKSLNLITK